MGLCVLTQQTEGSVELHKEKCISRPVETVSALPTATDPWPLCVGEVWWRWMSPPCSTRRTNTDFVHCLYNMHLAHLRKLRARAWMCHSDN